MNGKIVVIEGLDGSGKHSQAKLLTEKLSKEYSKIKLISFPNYESESCHLVKMYLGGKIDKDPNNVNPYTASMYYAVDRYSSYMKDWKALYEDGYLLIFDRYVMSNAICQMSKIKGYDDKYKYLYWLTTTEYDSIGLPKPTFTIYLSLSESVSDQLLSKRYNGDESKRDIHESIEFQKQCRESLEFIMKSGYDADSSIQLICDDEDGNIYSVEAINDDIYHYVKEILE